MRCLVVNCSAGHYNLGAAKLADWLRSEGHVVTTDTGGPGMFAGEYDLVALSVVFSWHAPTAAQIARDCADKCEVWAGGPGLTALGHWWKQQTGLDCKMGLDYRFERQPGEYPFTFASRGCPVGCYFCIVPVLEGKEFTLDYDFTPAPVLCDNNLSALPVEFQQHIIRRYVETETPLKDANSGFEPARFDGGTYERWRCILRGPWRLAFDETAEAAEVEAMLEILKDEPSRRKQVYVLIGNEPVEECWARVRRVIEWGGEPFCQPLIRLNALSKAPWLRYDWTAEKLMDFARFYNRRLWRTIGLPEYSNRKGERPPFAALGTAPVFRMV